jgi:ProP effector
MSTSKRMTPTRYANQLATAEATIKELVARWPRCFSIDPSRRQPLALGIRDEIQQATAGELSHRKVAAALAFYCGCEGYLQNMVAAAASRIGLHGQPAGQVSETEAEQASKKLHAYAQRRAERAGERQRMGEVDLAKGGRGKKGGLSEAARKAGITRRTAQRRMDEHKLSQNAEDETVFPLASSPPTTLEPKPTPSRPPRLQSTIYAHKQKATVVVERIKRRHVGTMK